MVTGVQTCALPICFSGETVTTKAKRKVKFVPLGMLRLYENVG